MLDKLNHVKDEMCEELMELTDKKNRSPGDIEMIGEIMDIKLPTVKTHVSHILTKLGVSRRSEAKTAARRLRLVE